MTRRRHAMRFGAELRDDGVRFALWGPSADVALDVDGVRRPMERDAEGWWTALVTDARAGSAYTYTVGDLVMPDPVSRAQQDDAKGPSLVVDPERFAWTDGDWRGRPWEEAVIYEVHVGTATPAGSFRALADDLERIRDTGATVIELMPIADFIGARNWGYDGVLPFAPDRAYGSPDDLKHLVDRAHALGLGVMLDVVYNHFGPSGNYLHTYAESFFTERHQTPWGAGLNFDGADGRPVRDFFIHNTLYWLEEYNLDGLRFDAVHAILDDSEPNILAEIAEAARALRPGRPTYLVLENESNQARWLERGQDGEPTLHTAQWNDDIHHCWHVLLTGEREAYYANFADDPVGRLGRCLAEGFSYQGEVSPVTGEARGERSGHLPPSAFVAFLQNHDQVGNRALGDRLSALAPEGKLALARAGLLLAPQIPMLFMGEEYSATTPFQFFVDFSSEPDLSASVRDGRRREFQHFAAFQGDGADAVPDPTAASTFQRSVLNPGEAEGGDAAAVLADTRRLIALRQEHVVPLTRSAFRSAEAARPRPDALDVIWRFEAGTLRFLANFGDADLTLSDAADASRILWASPDASPTRLPPFSGLFLIGIQ